MNKPVKEDLGNKELFAKNLARHLKASNKTQAELAKAVGVSPGTVSDWLKGRAIARMDTIQLVAQYFGVNKADLIEVPNYEKEDQAVLDLFHRVPEEKREFVLSMIRAAINNL